MKKVQKREKGITLIALVITIVVLLVLAGVSINLVVGENGLIEKTKEAKIATKRGEIEDYATLKIADLYVNNPLNTEDINDATILTALKADLTTERGYELRDVNTTNETVDIALTATDSTGDNISAITVKSAGDLKVGDLVDSSKTRVGYYADLEGDGTVDGVIYADLAFSVSDRWGGSYGAFSYTAQPGLKEYVVTKATYNDGHFGDAPVIAPKSGTSGNDRFYVMALSDVSSSSYYWDYNYDYDYNSKNYGTELTFGTGRSNTKKMVEYWDNHSTVEIPVYESVRVDDSGTGSGHYEDQLVDTKYISDWNSSDIWYNIKTQYNNNWFVPSRSEWATFAKNLGITSFNYQKMGLHNYYWSSSQNSNDSHYAWYANFNNGNMNNNNVNNNNVRLSTSFIIINNFIYFISINLIVY